MNVELTVTGRAPKFVTLRDAWTLVAMVNDTTQEADALADSLRAGETVEQRILGRTVRFVPVLGA